jgi:pimeloyl-ACP methyl ester carboxylesterase
MTLHPPLPPALPADVHTLDGPSGRLALYGSRWPAAGAWADSAVPLLLVHSVNAAASAAEVRPVFKALAAERPVYALDLPGYGLSERRAQVYAVRHMVDAVSQAARWVQARHGGVALHALAVSLGTEFLARSAVEHPELYASLALVSPTGLRGGQVLRAPDGSTRHVALADRVLRGPGWGGWLFRQLTRPGVIRYFLCRTWGRPEIDEALWAYAVLTARQPGAEWAPLSFLSAGLFSADIHRVYEAVTAPTLVVHGTRGDFTDYRALPTLAGCRGWAAHVMRDAGALPYFERPDEFLQVYRGFLGRHEPAPA